ncbi:hypothetical protein [Methanobrevibacter sp. DSM 116169]|uniref:hypothetical protein n=1 Tax=Methanobrevibacter sp. DSM 116169 TaxID=3242727 RepID=UPI0038FD0965
MASIKRASDELFDKFAKLSSSVDFNSEIIFLIAIDRQRCETRHENTLYTFDILDKYYNLKKMFIEGESGEITLKKGRYFRKPKDDKIKSFKEEDYFFPKNLLASPKKLKKYKWRDDFLFGIEDASIAIKYNDALSKLLKEYSVNHVQILRFIELKINKLLETHFEGNAKEFFKNIKEYEPGANEKSLEFYKNLIENIEKFNLKIDYEQIEIFYKMKKVPTDSIKWETRDLEYRKAIRAFENLLDWEEYDEFKYRTSQKRDNHEIYYYLKQMPQNLKNKYITKDLKTHFKYFLLSMKVNEFIREKQERKTIRELMKVYCENYEQEEISRLIKGFIMLKTYFNLSLLAEDWLEFKDELEEFLKTLNYYYYEEWPELITNLEKEMETFSNYYNITDQRTIGFFNEIEKYIELKGNKENPPKFNLSFNELLKKDKEVVIAIVNEYHVDKMLKILYKKGISHGVIVSNINNSGKKNLIEPKSELLEDIGFKLFIEKYI